MEEKQIAPKPEKEKGDSQRASREPLFGALLFGAIILILLAVVAAIGWSVYKGWRLNQEQASLPSITVLPAQEKAVSETGSTETKKEAGEQNKEASAPASVEEALKKAQNTEIKVLNGGGARGSAGTLADTLKKNGFLKVTVGNTIGNYAGTVIYYAAGLEQEAESVKTALLKAYPKVEAKPGVSANKETSQASLTVIVGR